jgi:hypothetical protein
LNAQDLFKAYSVALYYSWKKNVGIEIEKGMGIELGMKR